VLSSSGELTSAQENELRWLAVFGGVGFAVLTLIGWALWAAPAFPHLSPGLPSLSASPALLDRYYREHGDTARAGALAGTLALLPLLCFLVALYARMRSREGGAAPFSLLALLAGIMVCVVHFVFLSFLFQAAFAPTTVGSQVTLAMHYAGTAGAAASVLYATFLFAVAVSTLRYESLPRWTGLFAAIAAPLQLLYIPSIFGAQHIFDVTDGLFGVYCTFGTFLAWFIAAGIAMARRSPLPTAAGARSAGDSPARSLGVAAN